MISNEDNKYSQNEPPISSRQHRSNVETSPFVRAFPPPEHEITGEGLPFNRALQPQEEAAFHDLTILPAPKQKPKLWKIIFCIFGITCSLYVFFLSMTMMKRAIEMLGGREAAKFFGLIDNPIAGLMAGIFATVVLQVDSTMGLLTTKIEQFHFNCNYRKSCRVLKVYMEVSHFVELEPYL
jgi:hypothetical protein